MANLNKETKWVVADFETTTEKFYNENGYVKVWLYSICDQFGNITDWGDSIENFFDKLKKKYCGYTIYFHNLRFDGSFILNYLLNKKVPYKDKIYARDLDCFNTLIDDTGQFYQICLHYQGQPMIKIQDSLKLLPFPVRKIAQDFNLPMAKGSIDYDDYTINDETLEYVFNDVKIVALALNEIKQNGMLSMTTASCAYNCYKELNPFFNNFFPDLDDDFLTNYRDAYRGGRSQVNPRYANIKLNNVKRYDVNSMYPYVMSEMELPYGKPIWITKRNSYKFELYKVFITFKLKEGHLPSLLKKNVIYVDQSYYIEAGQDEPELLYISNIDFDILEKHYDIQFIQFEEMWGFKTTTALFKKYIEKWYAIKSTTKGAKKVIAKLMLNSLYGKFGSNFKGYGKYPYLDENEVLSLRKGEEETRTKYYLPIAIAITSWAHKIIDDAICATGVDKFVYCDTDSVHTLGSLPIDLIDNIMLGKFKLEGVELESKYVRQKTYVYSEFIDDDIQYCITCAGMDNLSKQWAINKYKNDIFDVFGVGFQVSGFKLVPKQVKGGCLLCKTMFEIRG